MNLVRVRCLYLGGPGTADARLEKLPYPIVPSLGLGRQAIGLRGREASVETHGRAISQRGRDADHGSRAWLRERLHCGWAWAVGF